MLEVLYRIYEVVDPKAGSSEDSLYDYGFMDRREITMDCLICESRDQFKDNIRSMYGGGIKFARPRNNVPGELYCIIIGEHAYDHEKYFNKVEFKCDGCGLSVSTYANSAVRMSKGDISWHLFNRQDEYINKVFCCPRCKDQFISREKARIHPDENDEFFVSRDMFTEQVSGYIYKITKKSTQEFYVGQTKYVPMFRWAEHLKTDRFPVDKITDYQYEILEIVPSDQDILEREKHWIQTLYLQYPELSLNIACTKNI